MIAFQQEPQLIGLPATVVKTPNKLGLFAEALRRIQPTKTIHVNARNLADV